MRLCSVEGCDRRHYGRDLCQKHYQRLWKKAGADPSLVRSTEECFWEKVDKTDDCWLWTAHRSRLGYACFRFNGKVGVAHRYAYELLVGPIPEGLTLDHLCRVRHCVNPAHLEPVTLVENILRGESEPARRWRARAQKEMADA